MKRGLLGISAALMICIGGLTVQVESIEGQEKETAQATEVVQAAEEGRNLLLKKLAMLQEQKAALIREMLTQGMQLTEQAIADGMEDGGKLSLLLEGLTETQDAVVEENSISGEITAKIARALDDILAGEGGEEGTKEASAEEESTGEEGAVQFFAGAVKERFPTLYDYYGIEGLLSFGQEQGLEALQALEVSAEGYRHAFLSEQALRQQLQLLAQEESEEDTEEKTEEEGEEETLGESEESKATGSHGSSSAGKSSTAQTKPHSTQHSGKSGTGTGRSSSKGSRSRRSAGGTQAAAGTGTVGTGWLKGFLAWQREVVDSIRARLIALADFLPQSIETAFTRISDYLSLLSTHLL